VDADHLRDLFSAFRPVTVRRMFSGAGIYAEGLIFAIVVDDVIYLKVDDTNQADFEREKLPPFRYTRAGGERAAMSYRRMPDRLYDDPDQLAQWAARAHAAASRKKRASAPAQRARKRKVAPKHRRLTKR
jgi:DNA transformation protein